MEGAQGRTSIRVLDAKKSLRLANLVCVFFSRLEAHNRHDATDLAGNRRIQVCPSASKQHKPPNRSRGRRQHKDAHEMKP